MLNSEEEPIIIENPDDVINVGVFIFNNNNDLEQAGNNLFRIANEDAEYEMDENAKLMKGYVEGSNVDLSEEMVKLIQIQKSFQLNSSIIRTADEIEQTINSLRG